MFPRIFITIQNVPVFKSESRIFYSSNRHIFFLSNISKFVEKLIHKRFYQFLDQQKCFYTLQFGFRFNISTDKALMLIIKIIHSSLDVLKFTGWVFVDLRKAFDYCRPQCLVQGMPNRWFRTYFKEKAQFISVENYIFSARETLAGVPEVSILGSLLFFWYIKNLQKCLKNQGSSI